MSGLVRPTWLRSKDPEKVADAMMLCRHPGGYCFGDGRCQYDGECFPGSEERARRAKEREDAAMARHEARTLRRFRRGLPC